MPESSENLPPPVEVSQESQPPSVVQAEKRGIVDLLKGLFRRKSQETPAPQPIIPDLGNIQQTKDVVGSIDAVTTSGNRKIEDTPQEIAALSDLVSAGQASEQQKGQLANAQAYKAASAESAELHQGAPTEARVEEIKRDIVADEPQEKAA